MNVYYPIYDDFSYSAKNPPLEYGPPKDSLLENYVFQPTDYQINKSENDLNDLLIIPFDVIGPKEGTSLLGPSDHLPIFSESNNIKALSYNTSFVTTKTTNEEIYKGSASEHAFLKRMRLHIVQNKDKLNEPYKLLNDDKLIKLFDDYPFYLMFGDFSRQIILNFLKNGGNLVGLQEQDVSKYGVIKTVEILKDTIEHVDFEVGKYEYNDKNATLLTIWKKNDLGECIDIYQDNSLNKKKSLGDDDIYECKSFITSISHGINEFDGDNSRPIMVTLLKKNDNEYNVLINFHGPNFMGKLKTNEQSEYNKLLNLYKNQIIAKITEALSHNNAKTIFEEPNNTINMIVMCDSNDRMNGFGIIELQIGVFHFTLDFNSNVKSCCYNCDSAGDGNCNGIRSVEKYESFSDKTIDFFDRKYVNAFNSNNYRNYGDYVVITQGVFTEETATTEPTTINEEPNIEESTSTTNENTTPETNINPTPQLSNGGKNKRRKTKKDKKHRNKKTNKKTRKNNVTKKNKRTNKSQNKHKY